MTVCALDRKTFGKYYERTRVTGIAKRGMYPFVSGEIKPVERRTNASRFVESGRVETGMGLKSCGFL